MWLLLASVASSWQFFEKGESKNVDLAEIIMATDRERDRHSGG